MSTVAEAHVSLNDTKPFVRVRLATFSSTANAKISTNVPNDRATVRPFVEITPAVLCALAQTV